MLGPLRLPRAAAKAVAVNVARVLKYGGRLVTPVSTRLPVGRRAIDVLSHSGFMLPVADPDLARRAIAAFLETPVEWYFHVALHTSRHPRISLSRVQVPAVFVAGTWDLLAGARAMASAAERMADAVYVELGGSHFLQMEHPDRVHDLLREFLRRVG
jgi:pimeloyl-ACP methyl ester carboxylesterase